MICLLMYKVSDDKCAILFMNHIRNMAQNFDGEKV